ncbi:MAG TPA: hypothetical protein PKC84_00125 [Paracoccaceae bacterium]|nr:hypothetical protein [Paracoccaceae bacterium]
MTSTLRGGILALALAFGAGTAGATPIQVEQQVTGGWNAVFGGNGYANATISGPALAGGSSVTVAAGGFALTAEGLGDFVAFCLDINTWLSLPSYYAVTETPFSGGPALLTTTQRNNIQALFNTGYAGLNLGSNTDSAAFQIALWEVLYDSSGSLNLGAGNFIVSSTTAVINRAAGLLAGLAGPATGVYELTWLQSLDGPDANSYRDSQNLVTATPIPLPAGGLLLVSALGLMFLRRRRTA